MTFKGIVNSLLNTLLPRPQIGGLEVTDSAIHFLQIRKEGAFLTSLRLPPGIIESGKIKEGEKPALVAALQKLHSQLTAHGNQLINAAVTLSDSNVYIQSFTVSRVAEDNLAEAAGLNLRMLSPIPIETSYFGWQKMDENNVRGKPIELLGAFTPAQNIDDITGALHEAGFGIAAVEFAALSLVRHLKWLRLIDGAAPYLIIHVTADGLNFVVARNGSLYFNYFHPWSLIQGEDRSISVTALQGAVETEIGKVLNFYASRWGGAISNLIIITPALEGELKNYLNERFPALEISVLNSDKVTVVGGAALRGKISRAKDLDISLTSATARKIFEEGQVLSLAALWRNILFTVAGFLVLIFAVTDIYLSRVADDLTKTPGLSLAGQVEVSWLKQLEDKADDFNQLVLSVVAARKSSQEISPLLVRLNNLAARGISFDRIYLQSLGMPLVITGTAASEEIILDFKRQLESQPQFADVSLPLSSIIMTSGGELRSEE